MKITKQEFDLLRSEDITIRQHSEILGKIHKRFKEICSIIYKPLFNYQQLQIHYKKDDCYRETFSVCENDNNNFCPDLFIEYIPVCGNHQTIYGLSAYAHKFPTRWLWENFEDERHIRSALLKEQEHLAKQKEKEDELKRISEMRIKEYKKLQKQIKKKLTQEELKIVKFKKC